MEDLAKDTKNLTINNFSLRNSLEQRKFINNFSLGLKICFFLMAGISLIKIGHNSKVRIIRLKEINASYIYETEKYRNLSNKFDLLLSLNAEQRFMKDQDQIISMDRLRVIWR